MAPWVTVSERYRAKVAAAPCYEAFPIAGNISRESARSEQVRSLAFVRAIVANETLASRIIAAGVSRAPVGLNGFHGLAIVTAEKHAIHVTGFLGL